MPVYFAPVLSLCTLGLRLALASALVLSPQMLPCPDSQVTETGWEAGALRARSLSRTFPLPPSSRCWEAERASNLAPIRSRPSPGSPAGRPARRGPSWKNFGELGVRAWSGEVLPLLPSGPLPLPPPSGPRPGSSSGDRTSPGRALCICKPEPRLPRAALPGRGCGCRWSCSGRCRPRPSPALSCPRRAAGRCVPEPLYKRGQGDIRRG